MLRFSVLAGVSGALAQADCADGDEVCLLQTNVENHYAMGVEVVAEARQSAFAGSVPESFHHLAECVDEGVFDELFDYLELEASDVTKFLQDYVSTDMMCAATDDGECISPAELFDSGEESACLLFADAITDAHVVEDEDDDDDAPVQSELTQVHESGAVLVPPRNLADLEPWDKEKFFNDLAREAAERSWNADYDPRMSKTRYQAPMIGTKMFDWRYQPKHKKQTYTRMVAMPSTYVNLQALANQQMKEQIDGFSKISSFNDYAASHSNPFGNQGRITGSTQSAGSLGLRFDRQNNGVWSPIGAAYLNAQDKKPKPQTMTNPSHAGQVTVRPYQPFSDNYSVNYMRRTSAAADYDRFRNLQPEYVLVRGMKSSYGDGVKSSIIGWGRGSNLFTSPAVRPQPLAAR